jgi:hypothetical protein
MSGGRVGKLTIAAAVAGVAVFMALVFFGNRQADSGPDSTRIVQDNMVVLPADSHDGKDEVWKSRPRGGKRSWGIRGSGYAEAGRMWFDGFPGESGRYKVELGAVLEADGDSEYRVSAEGTVLGEGHYGYACEVLLCGATPKECRYKPRHIDIGEHWIDKGETIEVWGRSTYPCGPEHGSYSRWFELRFTKVSGKSER